MATQCGILAEPTNQFLATQARAGSVPDEELASLPADRRQLRPSRLPASSDSYTHSRRPSGEPEHATEYEESTRQTNALLLRRISSRLARADRRWSWGALVYRDFRIYFAGSVVSNFGTWLQNTAQALLAYQLTHSVLAVGAVACAQFLWVLVLGSWAGAHVGRAQNVKGLLIAAQLWSAAVAAALAVLEFEHALTEGMLIAGALVLGLAYCLSLPAVSVLVPAFVPQMDTRHGAQAEREAAQRENQSRIRAAMALDNTSYNIGRASAPILAVLMIATIGFGWAFLLNALSFLALVAALRRAEPCSSFHTKGSARLMDSLRQIKSDKRIPLLLGIVATVTVSADPVLVLGPALARHFGASEGWAGYFLAALGAGTLLGSLFPAQPPTRVRHAANPLFLLGAAVAVFALGLDRWVSLAAAMTAGVACLLTGSAARALLFSFVSGRQESRRAAVMGIWAVAWAGSKPLASLADGVLATYIGLWAAHARPGSLVAELPGSRTAGVLLALPALVPAVLVLVRHLRDRGSGPAEEIVESPAPSEAG